MIGKGTKVYGKLEAWLKTAGLDHHELDVMRNVSPKYNIFLDGIYFAEYDSTHSILKLSGHCPAYKFQAHATEQAEFGKQYTLPAKAIVIEI